MATIKKYRGVIESIEVKKLRNGNDIYQLMIEQTDKENPDNLIMANSFQPIEQQVFIYTT